MLKNAKARLKPKAMTVYFGLLWLEESCSSGQMFKAVNAEGWAKSSISGM